MKQKIGVITSIILVVVVNLSHFWLESQSSFGIIILGFLIFWAMVTVLAIELVICLLEKFSNRKRNCAIVVMSLCLGCVYIWPKGFIDFSYLEPESLFYAQRKGAASCLTTFKIVEEGKFEDKITCFGLTKIEGSYSWKNDTLFFYDTNKSYFEFATIDSTKNSNSQFITRFTSEKDTFPNDLMIYKNVLF